MVARQQTAKVRVLLFGALAQRLGRKHLELPAEQSLGDLLRAIGCADGKDRVIVAVNHEQVHDLQRIVHAGDEVAIMPPFSGG